MRAAAPVGRAFCVFDRYGPGRAGNHQERRSVALARPSDALSSKAEYDCFGYTRVRRQRHWRSGCSRHSFVGFGQTLIRGRDGAVEIEMDCCFAG
jgi:hypothetical protein